MRKRYDGLVQIETTSDNLTITILDAIDEITATTKVITQFMATLCSIALLLVLNACALGWNATHILSKMEMQTAGIQDLSCFATLNHIGDAPSVRTRLLFKRPCEFRLETEVLSWRKEKLSISLANPNGFWFRLYGEEEFWQHGDLGSFFYHSFGLAVHLAPKQFLSPACAVGAGVKPPHVAAGRQIGRIKSIKREKLKAQETIVLEVTPESPGADYLWLKVWVRQRDFRILKTAIREKRFITEIIPQSWQKLPNGVAFPYELLILPLCPNRVPAADYRKVVFSEVKLNVGISDDAFALPANAYVLPADAYVWENLSSEKYLEKLQASPNSPELYYFLGRSYLNEHLTLLSIDAFKKAIELKPQMKVAYYRLIDAYRRAKQYDDAVKVYERLIKVDPESASQHYVGIASIYGEQGNDEKKMEMAKKAIETKPDDAEAHNLLARIYRYSKQYLSAVADTKKAIELESLPFPRYRYKIQLGEIYHEMGENDLAAATLEEAFKNAPEQLAREMAIHPLLETLKEVGRLDEAIARYEAELKVQPDRIELYKIVGRAYALKGDYKRAAKIYQQAIKADIHGSYDVDLYEALARTYEQTREFKKARCVYEELCCFH